MGTNIPQQKIPNVAPNFRNTAKSCRMKTAESCRNPAKSCRFPAENCKVHMFLQKAAEILQKTALQESCNITFPAHNT